MVTARHVVAPSNKLLLTTPDGKLWKTSNIDSLPYYDLAVVTFEPEGKTCSYPALKLGNSDKVLEGERIYIRGFPTRDGVLVSQFVSGDVSAIVPPLPDGYGISYQATTAGGMSGGPVMNAAGKVIAVHGRTDTEIMCHSFSVNRLT